MAFAQQPCGGVLPSSQSALCLQDDELEDTLLEEFKALRRKLFAWQSERYRQPPAAPAVPCAIQPQAALHRGSQFLNVGRYTLRGINRNCSAAFAVPLPTAVCLCRQRCVRVCCLLPTKPQTGRMCTRWSICLPSWRQSKAPKLAGLSRWLPSPRCTRLSAEASWVRRVLGKAGMKFRRGAALPCPAPIVPVQVNRGLPVQPPCTPGACPSAHSTGLAGRPKCCRRSQQHVCCRGDPGGCRWRDAVQVRGDIPSQR